MAVVPLNSYMVFIIEIYTLFRQATHEISISSAAATQLSSARHEEQGAAAEQKNRQVVEVKEEGEEEV